MAGGIRQRGRVEELIPHPCSWVIVAPLAATSSSRPHPLLREPLREHAAAVESFLRTAAALREEDWQRPLAPGKWAPAEVVEHVRLSFDASLSDVRDGRPMKILLPAWKRVPLRWVLVPRIIRTGRFPTGARAPREIRPASVQGTREEALARVRSAATELASVCAALDRPRSRRFTHAYFGGIRVPAALRFLARHTQHHEKQLAREPF